MSDAKDSKTSRVATIVRDVHSNVNDDDKPPVPDDCKDTPNMYRWVCENIVHDWHDMKTSALVRMTKELIDELLNCLDGRSVRDFLYDWMQFPACIDPAANNCLDNADEQIDSDEFLEAARLDGIVIKSKKSKKSKKGSDDDSDNES